MAVKKEKTEKVEKVAKAAAPKAAKKTAPKAVKAVAEKAAPAKKAEKKHAEVYFYAVGRRKSSVAQVRLFEDDKATDSDIVINGKKMKDYFPTANLQNTILSPLKAVGLYGKMKMTVVVRGGGVTGQVDAVRLGVARAIVKFNEEFKKQFKVLGYMTRDAREVERKKPGLKGARKAPQWAKR
jgi:small subunit ribosomal protein S9